MSETSKDWQAVVDLKPVGYAEFQNHVTKVVHHGDIESVTIENDIVFIRLKWVAEMPLPTEPGFGTWKKADDKYKVLAFPNHAFEYEIIDTPTKGKRVMFGFNFVYLTTPSSFSLEDIEKAAAAKAGAKEGGS